MQQQQQPKERAGAEGSGYFSGTTIAALASGLGGALSVVRLSGSGSLEALASLSSKPVAFFDGNERKASLVTLSGSDGQPFDQAVALYFKGPRSFTGEDVVEFQIHGSPYVLSRLFQELKALGVRQALPGEFSFRAVRNGKMSLNQAQAVADLIASSNRTAAEVALEKLSGAQNALLSRIADQLRRLAVLAEVGIDFSDQDVEEVSLPVLKKKVLEAKSELTVLARSFERGERIQEGISVSLLGLPNAGKSSFFNALLGEDRSIVSSIAGTTRDIIKERLVLEDGGAAVTLRLADTAGVRDSDDAIERVGVERTLSAARSADLILWVVDGSDTTADSLKSLETQWAVLGAPVERSFGIQTKMDLSGAKGSSFFSGKMEFAECSAVSGKGIHEAAVSLVRTSKKWVSRNQGEVILTREQDMRAAEECILHLDRAMSATEEDLFASDLRQALRAMTSLIGETVPDDILGAIFSGFCIGK